MYEIYEERLLNSDEGAPPEGARSLKAHLSMGGAFSGMTMCPKPIGDGRDPDDLVYVSIGDEGVTVRVSDISTAWLKMQKILGREFKTEPVITDEERERIAGIVEHAAEQISDAEAVELRAGMLRLLYAAEQRVPVATVDAEDFDEPIRTFEAKLLTDQDDRYVQGIVEGLQIARSGVLGPAPVVGHERDVELPHG